jgi:hypothetical protein
VYGGFDHHEFRFTCLHSHCFFFFLLHNQVGRNKEREPGMWNGNGGRDTWCNERDEMDSEIRYRVRGKAEGRIEEQCGLAKPLAHYLRV